MVLKSQKLKMDVQRYLMSHFLFNEEGAGLSEEKLRYQLMSHRDYLKREQLLTSTGANCNPSLIEQYFLHKLGFILE